MLSIGDRVRIKKVKSCNSGNHNGQIGIIKEIFSHGASNVEIDGRLIGGGFWNVELTKMKEQEWDT